MNKTFKIEDVGKKPKEITKMKKKELIEILKKKANILCEASKDYEDQDEKTAYGLEKASWAFQNVIKMLEDKKYYEDMKAIWLEDGE